MNEESDEEMDGEEDDDEYDKDEEEDENQEKDEDGWFQDDLGIGETSVCGLRSCFWT